MAERGRPSKLTAELTKNICKWLNHGMFIEDAARMVGIHKSTLYRWIEQGRKDRDEEITSLYGDFCDAIELARAQAEGVYLNSIKSAAARGQWQAAAWWLERSFEKWTKPTKVELGGSDKEPVKVQIKYSGDKG